MTKRTKHVKTEPEVCPFVIQVDQREKAPYRFEGIEKDDQEIVVPTESVHIKTGDYTIRGLSDKIAIERKSLVDLYGSVGRNRDRFCAEHERLAQFERAAVVIEASWYTIMHWPPDMSKLSPRVVWRTHASWFTRFGVPWFTLEDRRLSELFTFQLLDRFWRHDNGARAE